MFYILYSIYGMYSIFQYFILKSNSPCSFGLLHFVQCPQVPTMFHPVWELHSFVNLNTLPVQVQLMLYLCFANDHCVVGTFGWFWTELLGTRKSNSMNFLVQFLGYRTRRGIAGTYVSLRLSWFLFVCLFLNWFGGYSNGAQVLFFALCLEITPGVI